MVAADGGCASAKYEIQHIDGVRDVDHNIPVDISQTQLDRRRAAEKNVVNNKYRVADVDRTGVVRVPADSANARLAGRGNVLAKEIVR